MSRGPAGQRQDELASYAPPESSSRAIAQAQTAGPVISLEVAGEAAVLQPAQVTVRATLDDGQGPLPLALVVAFQPEALNGGARGGDVAPDTVHAEPFTAVLAAGTWSGEFTVPAEAFDRTGSYLVMVGGLADSATVPASQRLEVGGLPVEIELPAVIELNEEFEATVRVTNVLGQPVEGVTLRLDMSPDFEPLEPVLAGPQTLAPGEVLELPVRLRSGVGGFFTGAALADSAVGPSSAVADIDVRVPAALLLEPGPLVRAERGQAANVEALVLNAGSETARGTITIEPADGVDLASAPAQPIELEGDELEAVAWELRAAEPGRYRLRVTLEHDGERHEANLVLVVGGGFSSDEFAEAEAGPDADGTVATPTQAAAVVSDDGDSDGSPALLLVGGAVLALLLPSGVGVFVVRRRLRGRGAS